MSKKNTYIVVTFNRGVEEEYIVGWKETKEYIKDNTGRFLRLYKYNHGLKIHLVPSAALLKHTYAHIIEGYCIKQLKSAYSSITAIDVYMKNFCGYTIGEKNEYGSSVYGIEGLEHSIRSWLTCFKNTKEGSIKYTELALMYCDIEYMVEKMTGYSCSIRGGILRVRTTYDTTTEIVLLTNGKLYLQLEYVTECLEKRGWL